MNRGQAHSEMVQQLETLQRDLKTKWLKRSLPKDWDALESWHPVERHKTRVTLRLDSDMVKWFRALGPGYGPRINMVLRIYWTALLSGEVKAHYSDDTMPQIKVHAMDLIEKLKRDFP